MTELDLQTAAKWAAGKLVGDNVAFAAVGTDTRALPPRSLFVALRGPNFDGDNFIDAAFASGAVAALTGNEAALKRRPGIVVDDPARAFGEMAAGFRREIAQVPWFAVTGTNGKTTTRRLLAHILRAGGKNICEPAANFNNLIGVPKTLLQSDAATEFGVLEMGTSSPGEIRRLAEIARPTVAAITNISAGHLSGLKSLDRIAAEKQEIFAFLPDDGLAIFPAANAAQFRPRLPRGVEAITFAVDAPADVVATDIKTDEHGSRFCVEAQEFFLPLLGVHNVENCLIALIAARRFGIAFADAALADFAPVAGRLQTTVAAGVTLIDDAYNANPASIRAAAQVLAAYPAKRRVLLLADMGELGDESRRLHQELGRWLAATAIDVLLAVGDEMAALIESASKNNPRQTLAHYRDTGALLTALRGQLQAGDVVLVKGSHATNMSRVAAELKKNLELRV
ncbi:MAG: UDP-N-acetylmuramoyl-tripeptide--D-alanyl-D-alanine ligase [Planctomycetota bacterium]|jgi:UDP-N-acetylmuramoyl-tripeptide--D-alanyl-D-alanine ligase|nr:UDP-N-acetylmuramoyl-tripeptide--D-alanyl-D-alanine ligase [Planctomycetota bacterium]